MDNILTTGEYKAFFDTLHMRYAPSREKMIEALGKAIEIIADKLMLGKIEIKLISPPNLFSSAQNLQMSLYKSSMGFEDDPFIRRYDTGENGKAFVTACPVKGYHWGPEELEAVDLVCETIFMYSGRARLIELMEKANKIDALTTVPNQASIMAFGGMITAKGVHSKYTAIFINLKNFKFINKRGTSKGGDLCLKKYAHMMLDYVGKDGIFGRLGGDNFLCIIENSRVEDFVSYARKVTINCELPDKTHRFVVESRMGITKIKEEYSFSDVMSYVGIAIDCARTGAPGDIAYFNDNMYKSVMKGKEISAVFPEALAQKEFIVYYQPKVFLDDYSLCGCEALVRWKRNGILVPPMEFIPVLEREGQICDLDFYVFDSVCKDIREWLDIGVTPVKVSVNFSRLHLHNKELAYDIFAIMDKYGVDGKYIQVELTEMSGYEDYDSFVDLINILKLKGVSTAIDDFGTGYSSMNMLRNVNVDVIKLDKSFFEEEKEGSRKYEIMVRNVVRMINELGMTVIAEGIETIEQVNFLKDIGCGMTQGFYFDKPLPHDEYEVRLKKRTYSQE